MGSREESGQGNRKHEKQLQTKAGPSNLSHTRQDRTEEIISGDVASASVPEAAGTYRVNKN